MGIQPPKAASQLYLFPRPLQGYGWRKVAMERIPDFPSLGSNKTGFQPYGSRVLRTWGVAPGWYYIGALPLLPRLELPPLHPTRFERKIHLALMRCGATVREAPKVRLYASLGQRPRSSARNRPGGLKARLIPCSHRLTASCCTAPSVAGKSGMRPWQCIAAAADSFCRHDVMPTFDGKGGVGKLAFFLGVAIQPPLLKFPLPLGEG